MEKDYEKSYRNSRFLKWKNTVKRKKIEEQIKIAEDKIDAAIPAYTHMQKAQPVLLSHY